MVRSRSLATATLFVLLLAMAAPWAAEAAKRPGTLTARGAEIEAPAPLAPLGFLASLWHALTSTWGDSGCQLDPFGINRCTPTNPPSGSAVGGDSGCQIDPYGVNACSQGGPARGKS